MRGFSFKEADGAGELDTADVSFVAAYRRTNDLARVRDDIRRVWSHAREKLHVFACIHRLLFLQPDIQQLPWWDQVKARMGPDTRVLEVGVCFGTDLRQLLLQGLRPENATVNDLESGYFTLSQDMYKDHATMAHVGQVYGSFAAPFGELAPGIQRLQATQDLVVCMDVLHTLPSDQIASFLQNCFRMLKPDSGSFLIGQCVGSDDPGEWKPEGWTPGDPFRFLHSQQSLTDLLADKGFQHVQVSTRLRQNPVASPTKGKLLFIAYR